MKSLYCIKKIVKENSKYTGLELVIILIIIAVIMIFVHESLIKDVSLIGIASALIVYVLNLYSGYRRSREDKEYALYEKLYLNKYRKLDMLPTLVNDLLKSASEIKTMLVYIHIIVNSNKLDDLNNEDFNKISQYLLNNFDKINSFFCEYQKFDSKLKENNLNEYMDYYNLVTKIYQDYSKIYYNTLQIIKNNSINKNGDYNSINFNMCTDICKITDDLNYRIQYHLKQKTIDIVKTKSKKVINNIKYQILYP